MGAGHRKTNLTPGWQLETEPAWLQGLRFGSTLSGKLPSLAYVMELLGTQDAKAQQSSPWQTKSHHPPVQT